MQDFTKNRRKNATYIKYVSILRRLWNVAQSWLFTLLSTKIRLGPHQQPNVSDAYLAILQFA